MENNKKLKVLVVSYLPWRNDISVGNTLSNIFNGMEDKVDFASIYFRESMPNNQIANKYFCISEKKLIKSIITRKPVGKEVIAKSTTMSENEQFSSTYNKARQLRWEALLLIQDCIGMFGNWKSKALDQFVLDFEPDIVFGPLGRMPVSNNLMTYLHKKNGVPVITYAWDDHYSLDKISFSPFFWAKTFVERKAIKKCADSSSFLYTITEQMRKEYSSYFEKECKLLYKGYNFDGVAPIKDSVGKPVKIVYMGNIGSGRWQVLAKVAEAAAKINVAGKKVELYIYTLSPKSKEIEGQLNIEGASYLMKPVPTEDVLRTMQSADILLHVEPTTVKELLFFRLSFSTKLVDYFYNARCILALGGNTEAMRYLKDNDAAIIEMDADKIEETLSEVINNKDKIILYGKNAWDCGVRNHQLKILQEGIYQDFCSILNKNKGNGEIGL